MVDRLVKCGFTKKAAEQLVRDFIVNLSYINLQFFVESMEKDNVGTI